MTANLTKDSENNVEVNEFGGKQTTISESITELPPHAILEISRVMSMGAAKYGSKNWHNIPVNSEVDHALRHCFRYYAMSDVPGCGVQARFEELSHFATRAMMALDQFIREELIEAPKCLQAPTKNLNQEDQPKLIAIKRHGKTRR